MAATAIDTPSQRLPSTRPIDHRWDRSRGIIFSNAKRATVYDYTWSSSNGIVFSQAPATTRSYASRKIGASPAAPHPPLTKAAATRAAATKPPTSYSAVNNAHKGTNLAGPLLNAQETALLKSQKSNLEAEKRALTGGLQTAFRENQELDRIIKTLEAKIKQYQNDLIEKEQTYASNLRQSDLAHQQTIARVLSEAEPGRKENQRIIERARIEIRGQMRAEAQREQADNLQTAEEKAAISQELVRRLQTSQQQAKIQLDSAKEQIRLQDKRHRDLEAKYINDTQDRKRRSEIDRADYAAYRQIYSDLKDTIFALLGQLRVLAGALIVEARRWRRAAKDFRESQTLISFRQTDKYSDLKVAILDYLESRASSAEATEQELSQLREELFIARKAMQRPSHSSRAISRFFHLDEEQDPAESVEMAYQALFYDPIERHIDKAEAEKRGLQIKVDSCAQGSEEVEVAKRRLQEVQHQLTGLKLLAKVYFICKKIAGLEALLQDTPIEKLVYVKTLEHSEELRKYSEKYWEIYVSPRGTSSSDLGATHTRFSRDDREARDLLAEYKTQIRKRALLEEDLGQLSESEEAEHDAVIKRRIRGYQAKFDEHWAELAPWNKLAITTRRARKAAGAGAAPVSRRPSVKATLENRLRQWNHNIQAILEQQNPDKSAIASIPKLRQKIERGEAQLMESTGKSSAATTKERINGEESDQEWESAKSDASQQDTRRASKPRIRIPSRPLTPQARRRIERRRASRIAVAAGSTQKSAIGAGKELRFRPTEARRAKHFPSAFDCRGLGTHFRGARYSTLSPSITASSGVNTDPDLSDITHVTAQDEEERPVHLASQSTFAPALSADSDVSHAFSEPHDDAKAQNRGNGHGEASTNTATEEQEASQSTTQSCVMDIPSTPTEAKSTLTYHISLDAYRAAFKASPNTNAAFWSYKMYKNPAGVPPQVYYCKSFDVAEQRARLFLDEPVLGFDLEWEPTASSKSGIKHNVSLIQIAAEDKIGLFHMSLFTGITAEQVVPPSLRKILESPDIIKTGVNIQGDIRRVKEYLDSEMKGVFELSHLFKIVRYSADQPQKVNFGLVSLANQVQEVLMLPLKKDENRVSHWSRALNVQQSDYAASDAYAGFRLFHKLEGQRKALRPIPPRPSFYETFKPLILGDGTEVQRTTQRKSVAKNVTKAKSEQNAAEPGEGVIDAIEEIDPCELSASQDPDADIEGLRAAEEIPEIDQPVEAIVDATSSLAKVDPSTNAALPDRTGLSRPLPSKTARPDTPETRAADTWATALRASQSSNRTDAARPGELRAYHLWQEQNLSIHQIAALMRDPPLTPTTVASYIMEAVKKEDLAFHSDRIENEVLAELPRSVWWRYEKLMGKMKDGRA